ncbi:MAG TPA: DUF4157 domain-containing protein [Symbiobacteriaceae bacterium]|nr:DUF4157 domain-containing protein [Symbiobacteriaceae bacterium]
MSDVKRQPKEQKEPKAVKPEAKAPAKKPEPAPKPAATPLARAGPAMPLKVGAAQDPQEREAAAAANQAKAGKPVPKITPSGGAQVNRFSEAPEEDPLSRKPGGGLGAVASKAVAEKGPGAPMAPPVRRQLESSFGSDLSGVRVHDDDKAKSAASAMNAKAFTHGSDVFLGRGASGRDVGLMAHETAHVLQQDGVVRRLEAESTGGAAATGDPAGTLDAATETVTFDSIPVPAFKLDTIDNARHYEGLTLKRSKHYDYTQRPSDQAPQWRERINAGEIRSRLQAMVDRERAHVGDGPYLFQVKAGRNPQSGDTMLPVVYHGDVPTVATALTIPKWDRDGSFRLFQVDHIVEMQLSGWGVGVPADQYYGRVHTPYNWWLLEGAINEASGGAIQEQVLAKANAFAASPAYAAAQAEAQAQAGTATPATTTPTTATTTPSTRRRRGSGRQPSPGDVVKSRYNLAFRQAARGDNLGFTAAKKWEKQEIVNAEHMPPGRVRLLTAPPGQPDRKAVFRGPEGGTFKSFNWTPGRRTERDTTAQEKDWSGLRPFRPEKVHFDPEATGDNVGSFIVNVDPGHRLWERMSRGTRITLKRWNGAEHAAYPDREQVREAAGRLKEKHLSPIAVDTFDLTDDGVFVAGRVLTPIPLFRDPLRFEMSGNAVRLFKVFEGGELNVPRPLTVSESTFTIFLDSEAGFGVGGRIGFGIDRVGTGSLEAEASQNAGLNLTGRFNFDTQLFDRAEVALYYRNTPTGVQYGGEGDLEIGEGKIRGIRSGSVYVAFREGAFEATGTVQPAIPGVRAAGVRIAHSEEEGLTIGGSLELADNIPGIRSGSLDVTVRKGEDGAWRVAATGTAQPAIPGVETELTIGYDNGAITIGGRASYRRGMLSGSIEVGATNRAIDAEGQPSGEPGDRLTAYGSGSLTLRLAPWLQATAQVRILPNGELEVTGEIGLPEALDLFPQRAINRELFQAPSLDIPIFGVSVLGQRIGIFLTITGGLNASASIGPGQLRELSLRVTYNPDHEDQTTVSGGAHFVVPAEAGVRMYIRGGIGLGIPIVSASANLEIGGTLGIEGGLDTAVQVDWTPARGLVVDAHAEIFAQPKFKFDIQGVVLVEADLLFDTVTLYEQRWRLAEFEYGSDMRVGVRFPLHYEEGQPFDISLSDVEFITPRVDPIQMARNLIDRIA